MPTKTKSKSKTKKTYDQLSSLKGTRLQSSLKEIYEQLQKTTEESAFPGFSSLIEQFTLDEILKNETREVAQMIGFCVVEIYRLNEGIGFSDENNKDILEIVMKNLRQLESPSKSYMYQQTFHMFERLYQTALLKSIISLGDDGKDIAVTFFRTIFSILDSYSPSITPKKSKSKKSSSRTSKVSSADPSSLLTEDELTEEKERVKRVSMELLISIIDLFKHIPDALLDLILMTLLPQEGLPVDTKNPSHEIVEELLIVKKSKLASAVQKFCTSLMCAESASESDVSDSREHIFPILIALSEISSDYVVVLLPLVTRQLHVEDDKQRLLVVNCLSAIFGNSSYDYINQNAGPFEEFQNRFRDRSIEIRVAMTESCKNIILSQPSSLSSLLPLLQERIKDTAWEVRQSVVDSLCTLINAHISLIPTECFSLLTERVVDKRVDVRKYAITGLINIVSIHMASFWESGETPDRSLESKLGPVAAVLFRCYGVSDDETRNRCCRLFNEILVGKCESEECGIIEYANEIIAIARAYLWVFSELKKYHPILQFQESEDTMVETSVVLLRSLLSDWKKTLSQLTLLLSYAKEHRSIEDELVSKLLHQLSRRLSVNTTARTSVPIIHSSTNNCIFAMYLSMLNEDENGINIREALQIIALPSIDIENVNAAKKQLMAIIRELPEGLRLLTQFKSIFPRFYMTMCCGDMIRLFLEKVMRDEDSKNCLELLQVVCEECVGCIMTIDIQLRFFALLQTVLSSIVNETASSMNVDDDMRERFFCCIEKMTNGYEQYPFVFLNNNTNNLWNDQYSTELVPLIDLLLDTMPSFSSKEIKSISRIVGNFCRFVRSNNIEVDTLIQSRYDDWMNEIDLGLSISKEKRELIVDLSIVNANLINNCNTVSFAGIRNLVSCVRDILMNRTENQSLIENEEFVNSSIRLLFCYCYAVGKENNVTSELVPILFQCTFGSLSSLLSYDQSIMQFQIKSLFSTLKLACLKPYSTLFTPTIYYKLGIMIESIEDKSEAISVIHKIEHYIIYRQLPLKYICIMAILWMTDDSHIQQELTKSVRAVIRHQRRFVLMYQSSTQETTLSQSKAPLYQLAPEYLVVYLLPLLSRMKTYSDLSTSPTKIQIRCIDMILSELLLDNSTNIGLLIAIVNSIMSTQDGLEVNNPILHRLGGLTSQLLQKRLHIVKNVAMDYPESIRLPAMYYKPMVSAGTPKKSKKREIVESLQVTPEKSHTSTRGLSEEGDTPVSLRNMSPITEKKRRVKK